MVQPGEIMRVRDDHGTLYVRLPKWFRDQEHVTRGDYLFIAEGDGGTLEVMMMMEGVTRAQRAADAAAKGH